MSAERRAQGAGIDRREFLQTAGLAGAGLVVGFRLADGHDVESTAADFAPNGYLRIGTDGAITLFADHVEMGQGVMTALPMLVAEELDADWAKVRIERMPDNPAAWPRTIYTIGSGSVPGSWGPLRRAGATARQALVAAAAQKWNVPVTECRTENSHVIHDASNRRATYGELAVDAAAMPPQAAPAFKSPDSYRIIGKPVQRVDIPSKVNGTAQFGVDVRLPGMLTAMVIRPPVFGGKVKTMDATEAKAIPGVVDVVPLGSGIAVVANDTWTALKARRAVKVEWDDGRNEFLSSDLIRSSFARQLEQRGIVASGGTAAGVIAASNNVVTADYELPFAAHVPMEPINCTAHVRADGTDVWVPTQGPSMVQQQVVQLVQQPSTAVRIHVTMMGGGFGRRTAQMADIIGEAVSLSRTMRAPVKVLWTREDDMQFGFYRPFGVHRMTGALDADGWPSAWLHRIVTQDTWGPSDAVAGANLAYALPNQTVERITAYSPVPVGAWRAVGHSQNGFVNESFLDELAVAGKKDPVELRRRLLAKNARALATLDLAVAKSDWGKPMPAGFGRGVAMHTMGSCVAQIAEVSVVNYVIRVHKVICAVACGTVINPDTVAAQIEGAVIYGLTCALKNEITIAEGKVEQDNFHTYPMLRMSEAPVVETHFVPSQSPPSGVGEVGVPPIAAAVANAVFAATGQRLRKQPFRVV